MVYGGKILKIVTLHNVKEDKRVDLSFVALTSFDGKKKSAALMLTRWSEIPLLFKKFCVIILRI